MGRFNVDWTPKMDAKLKRLIFEERLTYKEIGTRFGASRGAIAGRCKRLGITAPKREPMRHAFAERLSVHGDIALAAQEIGTNRHQGHNLMGELRRDLGWQAQ